MSTLTLHSFNPLTFANRLKDAGVPANQAELEAEVLHEALSAQARSVSALETKVQTLASETRRDTQNMATKADITLLEAKIALARRDTIIWLGGISIAGFSLVITVLFALLGQ